MQGITRVYMKKLISLLPIVVILALSYYAFQTYEQLPQATVNGLIFLPHLLALFTLFSAIHFKRSGIFFYALVVILVYSVLKFGPVAEPIVSTLLAISLSSLLVAYTLFPERSVFTINNLNSYLIFFATIGITFFTATQAPIWQDFLLTQWLPVKYFDWTALSQTSLTISSLGFISLLIIFALKPSPFSASAIGILLLLVIQLHFGNTDKSLIVLSSGALLLCLYAVIQESWRMAYLDELTGLPGRRALKEKFNELNSSYSVAMLDIDHFKKFNDTYGHDVGDSVLRMIASKISKVSGGGFAYRYGGEEFSVIFPNKDKHLAKVHLELLREEIASQEFVVNRENRRTTAQKTKPKKKKTVQITISMGLADTSENKNQTLSDPWDVLKLADKALYRAKKKGRNCISV